MLCFIHVTRSFLISDIPWIFIIYTMLGHRSQFELDTDNMEGVIRWFASPNWLKFYLCFVIIRALLMPLIRLTLGITIKRLLGFNMESKSWDSSQMALIRRYINSRILSNDTLSDAFSILDFHYEVVSVSFCVRFLRFRLMTILAILGCLQVNGC